MMERLSESRSGPCDSGKGIRIGVGHHVATEEGEGRGSNSLPPPLHPLCKNLGWGFSRKRWWKEASANPLLGMKLVTMPSFCCKKVGGLNNAVVVVVHLID